MPDWLHAPDYWIARLLLQRGLGVIYLSAFAVALGQFRPLLGEHGLLPVPEFVERRRFRDSPSIFFWRYSDRMLVGVALMGMAIALSIVLGVPDHLPLGVTVGLWLLLWALYLSIVNVGQTFYSFGWETLLLEAGFLAAFLGPAHTPVPVTLIWLFRWMLFRVEFGAGLIKMRGDSCWRDFTCLYYHHETQPMPNPLSWYFQRLPKPLHRIEVIGSHFAQLVAPVALFLPQPIASVAGLVMIVTQAWLVVSGNYAWLNAVTMLLGVSAISDAAFQHVLPIHPTAVTANPVHDVLALLVTAVVLALSYKPARNLLSSGQIMNTSFEPLHLVNTYGAFGSVTRQRKEVVVEGTTDDEVTEHSEWREYEFKAKPTDPKRRPPQFAPYHLRLDWLMWFAALSPAYAYNWFLPFVVKLLQNDRSTLKLIKKNPFPDKPPHAVRAVLYEYRYTTWKERRETGAWWVRKRLREYLPPITLREVEES
ncbi:MAG: lipase maturation factor family protein [Myxococcaceae bacterium]